MPCAPFFPYTYRKNIFWINTVFCHPSEISLLYWENHKNYSQQEAHIYFTLFQHVIHTDRIVLLHPEKILKRWREENPFNSYRTCLENNTRYYSTNCIVPTLTLLQSCVLVPRKLQKMTTIHMLKFTMQGAASLWEIYANSGRLPKPLLHGPYHCANWESFKTNKTPTILRRCSFSHYVLSTSIITSLPTHIKQV